MRPTVIPVPAMGAEDVLVGHDGAVWTGTEEGSIWRVDPEDDSVRRVARTGGRPLGLEWLPDGAMLVCDAHRGLLRVDVSTGEVVDLLRIVEGRAMVFCNNAAVSADGGIWFSDSSTMFSIERWKDDFLQGTRTGRLLHRSADGEVQVVLDGLAFANGVALAADESWVAVAETGARTVVRHWLSGARAGRREFLVEGLPGYPDNISRGSDGLVWVTIASPSDPMVERLQKAPMVIRRLATKIPERLQPAPKQTVRVQAYDDSGRLVHDLDLEAVGYHMVTGVREHRGRVWMGSLHEGALAVVDLQPKPTVG
ncbi:SMP-30/gluconolactonase/LRE family protein [Nocardioides alcanivorans]|uniref:SMP-30/gluconolactonase/LRE family protein n=1 Tax=Nocardioides alcanivorans TaxID=2897352 RepID=UPI001F30360F|nr:SMP-30/gluconolactonase/LRE family protein [Nocardioides alcanivorans]